MMNTVRTASLRHSVLSVFLLAILAGCAALPSASVMTNVPSNRLSHDAYTSPDGGYRATIPHLNADAKVEEHQIGPDKHGVRFSDASGTAYRVLRIDNTDTKFTLEQISDQSKVGEFFRENRYVYSDRGTELRLVGLRKEGSPLVSRKKEGDLLVARKKDLYRADSIFAHGIYLYEISAGVTASQGQSDDVLFEEAKRHLNEFLKGVSIK
ncbi:MAG: hypothetical protein ABIQ79_06495 [Nitrospiraceae bacterium]